MVTLKEIAKTVGVSSGTVSRVLNFDTTLAITEIKRQAIIETAEALDYKTPRVRNRVAPKGVSKIALVHFLAPEQELADPYYVSLRLGIESRCQALKIELAKVYHTNRLPEAALLQSASGVIVIGPVLEEECGWVKRCAKHVVMVDNAAFGLEVDSVGCDLALATRKLLSGLTEADYERIGFVGWDEFHNGERQKFAEKRARTYRDWMQERSIFDAGFCKTKDNTAQSGYQLTLEMLSSTIRPDAIIAGNDSVAVGAYRAISELGLSIPNEIAVASFNDISAAQFLSPPLTTVHLPAEEIGETAVDLLLEQVSGRTLTKHVTLSSKIKWRGSTRPRPSQ